MGGHVASAFLNGEKSDGVLITYSKNISGRRGGGGAKELNKPWTFHLPRLFYIRSSYR